MEPDLEDKPKRTTVAVSVPFWEKLTDLARHHDLSIADYCDGHLDEFVDKKWRDMLKKKLTSKAGA